MRVLVSGFGPFLEEKVNPSEAMVQFVNSCSPERRKAWASIEVRGVTLPVDFEQAFPRLEKERAEFQADVVLSFGLAAGRTAIEIEQLAVNFRGTIDPLAPITLATTLPSDAIVADLLARGIPARPSLTAGTYVCNHLFFKLQDRLRFTRVRSGFIHVPRMAPDGASPTADHWPWQRFEDSVDSILATLAKE